MRYSILTSNAWVTVVKRGQRSRRNPIFGMLVLISHDLSSPLASISKRIPFLELLVCDSKRAKRETIREGGGNSANSTQTKPDGFFASFPKYRVIWSKRPCAFAVAVRPSFPKEA